MACSREACVARLSIAVVSSVPSGVSSSTLSSAGAVIEAERPCSSRNRMPSRMCACEAPSSGRAFFSSSACSIVFPARSRICVRTSSSSERARYSRSTATRSPRSFWWVSVAVASSTKLTGFLRTTKTGRVGEPSTLSHGSLVAAVLARFHHDAHFFCSITEPTSSPFSWVLVIVPRYSAAARRISPLGLFSASCCSASMRCSFIARRSSASSGLKLSSRVSNGKADLRPDANWTVTSWFEGVELYDRAFAPTRWVINDVALGKSAQPIKLKNRCDGRRLEVGSLL